MDEFTKRWEIKFSIKMVKNAGIKFIRMIDNGDI